MSKHAAADLRNVVLVGHGDAGKTTLAEHLLAKMGAVSRLGSVKEKTSTFDYEPDEKDRGHSIDCAVAHGVWKGKEINLVDCPGYPDFFGEVVTGVSAGDLALVCVNANAGILVGTRRGWLAAEARGRARGIVVTKCDLVDETTREVVELEIRDLVHGSFLESAPIIRTSANSGLGIEELKRAIFDACLIQEGETGRQGDREQEMQSVSPSPFLHISRSSSLPPSRPCSHALSPSLSPPLRSRLPPAPPTRR